MIENRGTLRLREYGRNIQNIANYVQGIEDKEERSKLAEKLVLLMKQINPGVADASEGNQKFWDHMHIISDFGLDIEAPFPAPDKEVLAKKPKKMPYARKNIKFRAYGHNVGLIIDKILETEDAEKRLNEEIYLARLMKTLYFNWNREQLDDEVLAKHILELSNGKIKLDWEKSKQEGWLDMNLKSSSGQQRNNQHKRRNKKRR